jgi:hypothetical protein
MDPLNKSRRLDQLVTRLECLLARLPNDQTPEIVALRDKVDHTIQETWIAVTRERASLNASARESAPFIVGTAILVGITAGYLAFASIGRRN